LGLAAAGFPLDEEDFDIRAIDAAIAVGVGFGIAGLP